LGGQFRTGKEATMTHPLYFEELQPGDRWRSLGRTITQADAARFVALTGDATPLYMDHEFARESVCGRAAVNGLFGLSLLQGLGQHSPQVSLLALLVVRDWTANMPLYVGDTVYVLTEVLQKSAPESREGTVVFRRQLVNQRSEVAQEATFETLVALLHTATHDAFRKSEPASERSGDEGFRFRAA
jgi:3-hydroxybutyryl-CoA dehydratase